MACAGAASSSWQQTETQGRRRANQAFVDVHLNHPLVMRKAQDIELVRRAGSGRRRARLRTVRVTAQESRRASESTKSEE